jgi:murein DD-endopeptidase MepM/ murein hydrolase activator NlpD
VPGRSGHQGQDIRPSSCKQRVQGANRCERDQHDVVAVRDGMVVRSIGQMPVYLFVNALDEHIRFRYLHMFPRQFDQEGLFSGRILKEGEAAGKVGNFIQHERATTYHLHFDMQVPTKYGWVFVNPYMTLVAAYERLIGGARHRDQRGACGRRRHDADRHHAAGLRAAATGGKTRRNRYTFGGRRSNRGLEP